MLLFLDTTVLIDHLRGRPAAERVTALAERGVRAATTAINIEEIVRGLRPPEEVAAQQLGSGLIVMPITAEAAWIAGTWRRTYAALGKTLWQADCLIAAAAHLAGAPPATGSPKDFPMPGVDIQHWPVGE